MTVRGLPLADAASMHREAVQATQVTQESSMPVFLLLDGNRQLVGLLKRLHGPNAVVHRRKI